jgi:DNA repair exonuclease SbcCD ATPase subunit
MIIKRVAISNWRGIERFEAELSPGVNLLRGRNEAGKSSVVEALSWALHRDLVGGARVKDEIAPVIPAHNSKLRPCVELALEFSDCTATITKMLSEDSARRECCLVVRRDGQADATFDQAAAQNKLRRLMMSDAFDTRESTSAVDVSLLVSPQGQSTAFVGQELSSAARAGIALGEDGAIAPTSRLEKVLSSLEKKRGKELFEKLKSNAVDAAKKASEAARVRDELAALREEYAKYSRIEGEIASLRAQIATLRSRLELIAPRAADLEQQLANMRARREQQTIAERELAEKRRAFDEAKSARDRLQRQCEEIKGLRATSASSLVQLDSLKVNVQTAREQHAQLKEEAEAAWREHENAEAAWRAAREKLQAWDLYGQLCAASSARKQTRERLEQIEKLAREVEEWKTRLDAMGRVPTRPQLAAWNNQFFAIENARNAAAQTLQLWLCLEHDMQVEVEADDSTKELLAAAGEEVHLGAQSELTLRIPGFGEMRVASAAREAQKQNAENEARIRSLQKDLAPFGLTLADLPDAFADVETRIAEQEAATQESKWSERQLQDALQGESLDDLRAVWQEADEEYSRLREACEPVRGLLPEEPKPAQANIERERVRLEENAAHEAAEGARRRSNAAAARAVQAAKVLSNQESREQLLLQERQQNLLRLAELESDELDEEARAAQLDQKNGVLYFAQRELQTVETARAQLGQAVTTEVVDHAAYEAAQLADEKHTLESELATRRGELSVHCAQDPQSKIDELSFEIEEREIQVEKHEARLRGLAILEAALEAQRHRLGRAIAAPLNTYLSPWLSELRGKPTQVEFDETNGRLTGVQTREGESTFLLPFASHSAGMQEQTALALRLILAQAAAKKLPTGKLPLVLDDPLTQSDSLRRDGLWKVLSQAASHLQILFATCHETHLPIGADVQFLTLGEWSEEDVRVAPQALSPKQPLVEIDAPKKTRPRLAQKQEASNGNAATLPLW